MRHNQKCHAGNIPLHCQAPWGVHCHIVLPHIECCLEQHTIILLHQCCSTILSPHYALTAPDCSLQAGRPLSIWSESVMDCRSLSVALRTNSRADCPDMALHAQMFDWLVYPLNFLFWDMGVRVCVCVRLYLHMDSVGQTLVKWYLQNHFFWCFSLLGVIKWWALPHSDNRGVYLQCLVQL